jgi:esterase/lipase superfamily enzyme
MESRQHQWHSVHLGQEMTLQTHGRSGKPILVFPTSAGRYFDWAHQGMVEAVRIPLEAGQIQLICVDSIDRQSWLHPHAAPDERAARHSQYERYLLDEVLPFVQRHNPFPGLPMTAGCSMGAYHAANLFFRHPERFDGMLGMSGAYKLNWFFDQPMTDAVYYHVPLSYLANLHDPWYLEQYRRSRIVFCAGQGAGESRHVEDSRRLSEILTAKGIPHWFDLWGWDVSHDWHWWARQLPYFLAHFDLPQAYRQVAITAAG